jgi:hypothetical protein
VKASDSFEYATKQTVKLSSLDDDCQQRSKVLRRRADLCRRFGPINLRETFHVNAVKCLDHHVRVERNIRSSARHMKLYAEGISFNLVNYDDRVSTI